MYQLSTMRNTPGMKNQNMIGMPPQGMMPNATGDSHSNSVAQWVQEQNAHLQQQGMNMSPNFNPNNPNNMPPQQQPPHPNSNPNNMPPQQQPGGNMMSWPPQQQPQQQPQSFPPNSAMQNFGPMGPQPGQQGFNGPNGMQGPNMNPNMNPNFMHGKGRDLMQSKVPNENLTPEQLQRREEQLANLAKIQAMLFPDRQPGMNPQGPGGMMPGGGPNMGPNNMFPGDRLPDHMTPPPHDGMMTSPGMMSPTSQMMMFGPNSPGGMPPGGGGMPPGGGGMPPGGGGGMPPGGGGMPPGGMPQMCGPDGFPMNPANMNPAQRDWMRLQQEFAMDKHKHRQNLPPGGMAGGGMPGMPHPGMQNAGQGPPPPYHHSIPPLNNLGPSSRRPGMPGSSPTSPSSALPMGSPHPMSSGHPSPLPGDPHNNFMFPGQRRPSFGNSNHPGMMGGFPPQGGPPTPGTNFDPNMPMNPMDAGMPGGPGGPMYKDRMRPGGPTQGVPNPPQGPPTPQAPTSQQQVGPPTPVTAAPLPAQAKMREPPVLQRAGNPEQFAANNEALQSPGTPTSTPAALAAAAAAKPPPTYAQSTKRKRGNTEELEELYKKLQPAPSPQQINYLNQFEGQELTITKQRNTAYRGDPSEPSPPTQQQPVPSPAQIQSPMSVPGVVASSSGPASVSAASPMTPVTASSSSSSSSATGAMTTTATNALASSSAAAGQMSSASGPGSVPSKPGPSPLSSPGPAQHPPPHTNGQMSKPAAGASPHVTGHRLSHYDLPPHNPPPPASRGGGGGATTTTGGGKNSYSNITSASLANLAKGVEHLSNQMQQNMMQGGPFHNIQIQGQMSDISSPGPHPAPHHGMESAAVAPPHMSTQSQPSVNNTFVNATMSIQQLNIQSVNQGAGGGGCNPSMPVQQMTAGGAPPDTAASMTQHQHAPPHHHHPHPASSAPSGVGGMNHTVTHTSMSQTQSMMHASMSDPGAMNSKYMNTNMAPHPEHHKFMNSSGGPSPGGPMPPHAVPGPRFNGPGGGGVLHRGPSPGMLGNRGPSPGLMNTPGFRQSAAAAAAAAANNVMGNANVQIQAKAPNTIQYLPASPPMSQAGPMPAKRQALDPMIQRFGSPGIPGMDTKMPPTSKLQYLPTNNGPGPPMMASMGPEFDPFSPGGGGGKMSMSGGPMGMHPSVMMPGGSPQGGGMNMQYPGNPASMQGPHPSQPMMGGGGGMQMMQTQSMHAQQQQQFDMQGLGPGLSPGPVMNPAFPSPGGAPDQMMMRPAGNHANYDAQFQQFQHQLYSQGRTRQMGPGPMGPGAMVGPGGMGPGGMGPGGMMPSSGMHPGMNPNMGPSPGPPGMGPGGGPNMGGHAGGMVNMGPMGGMMQGMGGNPNMAPAMGPGQHFMNMMP